MLTKISGVTFDEALVGAQNLDLDDCSVPYIGRGALIGNKRSAGRHKDLADVDALEQMSSD